MTASVPNSQPPENQLARAKALLAERSAVFIPGSQPLESQLAWARALLAEHSANIPAEFLKALLVSMEPGVQVSFVKAVSTSGTPWFVIRPQMPQRTIELLSALEAGDSQWEIAARTGL